MRLVHIDCVGEYKPGDMPPTGYMEWMEWADVQDKAGLKQNQCGRCDLWCYPQEMTDKTKTWSGKDRRGKTREIVVPICKKCVKP